ncbi:hypothetical protein L202_06739 [Cryptococcus amylolentus CBS 6039]|uniref:Uncharacterized protein n=2 Tax=Cryptococcus amylolentus TaxID=104669 RepID=A0A1E3HDA5_9TREE|nr:hypothetical protein L202_06739 [Cryptococcus amylolentus CBS 6039]ODN74322.1 hypothetical protein L202_06739 [Cryptococcus amylolentus CBS 6039]ODO01345.1 hypothetical protein I350_06164 [Cryptococcus amylolentus CBS 6273]
MSSLDSTTSSCPSDVKLELSSCDRYLENIIAGIPESERCSCGKKSKKEAILSDRDRRLSEQSTASASTLEEQEVEGEVMIHKRQP